MVGLGFEGGVGIKLGRSSLNIDGGLTGLIFPRTMVNSKLAGQCCLHTFSAGSSGKRKTVALFPSSKLPLQRVTQHFFPF